jgi:hypothetical protein
MSPNTTPKVLSTYRDFDTFRSHERGCSIECDTAISRHLQELQHLVTYPRKEPEYSIGCRHKTEIYHYLQLIDHTYHPLHRLLNYHGLADLRGVESCELGLQPGSEV